VEAVAPAKRDLFRATLGLALQHTNTAVTTKRIRGRSKIFGIWVDFCDELEIPCTLHHLVEQEHRLLYLLAFGIQYRLHGQKNHVVRASTVSDALQAVGKGISDLGHPDPRKLKDSDDLHPLLTDFLASLAKEDDPSSRAYPANISIIERLWDILDTEDAIYGTLNQHVINLIIIAYYFLLRPCEYCANSGETQTKPFELKDVQFSIGIAVYPALLAPLNDEKDLDALTGVSLTFFDQKNGLKGEQVGHAATSDPRLCPAKAMGRIVLHLRKYTSDPTTKLYEHYNPARKKWYKVKAPLITNALRHSAQDLYPQTSIDPDLVSCRSLRPGGATALLCAKVDTDYIMLMGRWRSDAMFRYLRAQAATKELSQKMLEHGAYTFHPQAFRNNDAPKEAPAAIIDFLRGDADPYD